jgi:hypothetical protein
MRPQINPHPHQPKQTDRHKRLWINAKTLEGALDPLALSISLCISLAAVGAGIYSIIKSRVFADISVRLAPCVLRCCRVRGLEPRRSRFA